MASFMATSIVSDPGTARPPNRSHCRGPDLQFASTGTRPEKITERPWWDVKSTIRLWGKTAIFMGDLKHSIFEI